MTATTQHLLLGFVEKYENRHVATHELNPDTRTPACGARVDRYALTEFEGNSTQVDCKRCIKRLNSPYKDPGPRSTQSTPAPVPAPTPAGITYMGRSIGITEVDISDHSTTRAVVAFIPLVQDGAWIGMPLGVLTWDRKTRKIELVFVQEGLRRKGLATRMLEVALTIDAVEHSDDRSPDGTAWAKSTEKSVPPVKARRTNAESHAMGSRLMVVLHGFGPDDVRSPMLTA